MLGPDFEDEFDQDLCLNLWNYFKKLLWKDELNPRVRCAFGNVFLLQEILRYSKQKREGTAIVLEEPQSKQNNRQDINQTGHGQVNQVIAHLNHDTDMEKA